MENKTKTIEDAIAIAADAHKGQKDKAGAAYILHPLRLIMKMETEAEMLAAVLHDVIEDTGWTIEKLREEGFPDEVLAAVESVTKREGEDYDDFITRASQNPIGRRVKIGDLEDNLNTLRLSELQPKQLDNLAKCHRSWRRLSAKQNA